MGTISAVNTIVEGMTPVTNMDDSIHGDLGCFTVAEEHAPEVSKHKS